MAVVRDLLDLHPVEPSTPSMGRLGTVGRDETPRFLVPLGWSAATSASLLSYQAIREPRTRLNRRAVATALALGGGRGIIGEELAAATDPDSLLAHLATLLDQREIAVAVGVGRWHDLWRATLQVFHPDGTPLAYVKVGRDEAVNQQVLTDGETLAGWGAVEDPRLVVPELVARSCWRDLPVLVVAPMPSDARRLPPGPQSAWAVRTLDAPIEPAPLTRAPWWMDRRRRHADDPAVDTVLSAIEARHHRPDHHWARLHGDWVPWNLARCSRGLVAWDWEYSEPGGPVGVDETHYAYQVARVARGRPVSDALAVARAAADSPWVADAHLAMLITRSARHRLIAGQPMTDHLELLRAAQARFETAAAR